MHEQICKYLFLWLFMTHDCTCHSNLYSEYHGEWSSCYGVCSHSALVHIVRVQGCQSDGGVGGVEFKGDASLSLCHIDHVGIQDAVEGDGRRSIPLKTYP